MIIEVTREIIERAERHRDSGKQFSYVSQCPIAKAIRAALEPPAGIRVTGSCVIISSKDTRFMSLPFSLPSEAQLFAVAFDNGRPLSPLTFEIDYVNRE